MPNMSKRDEPMMNKSANGSPDIEPLCKVHLRSGTTTTRRALEKVLHALEGLKLDSEERHTVELVVAEALNNIVEHAYPETGNGGPIDIECTHRANGLHFAFFDEGQAMPDGTVPFASLPDLGLETEDLPDGGFGWFIINELAKDVVYERVADRNELRLRIAVAYGVDFAAAT